VDELVRSPQRVLPLLVLGGVLGVFTWAVVHGQRGSTLVGRVASGQAPLAPPFSLPPIWRASATWPSNLRANAARSQLRLADLRGYPVVINFWASWCGPCRSEIPRFTNAAARLRGKVAFLGVDIQDVTSDARAFLPRFHVNYVSVRDGSDGTYGDYGLTGVPETYFVSADGRIVRHVPGVVTESALEQGLRAIQKSPRTTGSPS
jgi:cytochrome c biogenesis protein CcmG, thiol:disulfide interchange protein DsbE